MKWEWKIVEDPEPDPQVEAWLDYMSELSKIADTCAYYIGPAHVDPPGSAGDSTGDTDAQD